MNIKLFALAGVALGALAGPVAAAPAKTAPASASRVTTRSEVRCATSTPSASPNPTAPRPPTR